jgi:hypothetical protein
MPDNLTPQKIKELEAKGIYYAKKGGSKKSDMQYMGGGAHMGMKAMRPMNEEVGMVAMYGGTKKKMMKKGGKVMKGYMMRGGSKKNR